MLVLKNYKPVARLADYLSETLTRCNMQHSLKNPLIRPDEYLKPAGPSIRSFSCWFMILMNLILFANANLLTAQEEYDKSNDYQVFIAPGFNFTQFRLDSVQTDASGLPYIGIQFRKELNHFLYAGGGMQYSRRGSDYGYLVYEYRNDYFDFMGMVSYRPGKGLWITAGYQYSMVLNSFVRMYDDPVLEKYTQFNTGGFLNQHLFTLGLEVQLVKGLEIQFNHIWPAEKNQFRGFQAGLRIDIDLVRPKVSGNKFYRISDAIKDPYAVESLILQRKDLSSIPPEVFSFPNLQELVLDGNKIQVLPDDLGRLTQLTRLSLQYNQLETLPGSVGNLQNLRELRLGNNQLVELPPTLGNLENLQFLYIGKNNLKKLPDEIGKLEKLIELDLARSGVMLDIPVSAGNLRRLERLYIDRTTRFPYDWQQSNPRLQVIYK
jgi:hypothetical protein